MTEAYIGPAPTNKELGITRKFYDVYGSGDEWFYNIPGDETNPSIKLGPYNTKDAAEWSSSEAEATIG